MTGVIQSIHQSPEQHALLQEAREQVRTMIHSFCDLMDILLEAISPFMESILSLFSFM